MWSTMFRRVKKTTMPNDEDNSDEIHKRPTRSGVYTSQSRIVEIQQAQMEARLHQLETLYAADRARAFAVLERLGLQGDFPSPQPPSVERQRPGVRPDAFDKEEEDLYLERGSNCSPSVSICSDDTHRSVDCCTPSELSEIQHITSPLDQSEWDQPAQVFPPLRPFPPPPRPPANLQPMRRVSRVPVMYMKYSKTEKEVAGGYKLQTAKGQVEELQKGLGLLMQNIFVSLPQPNPQQKPPVCPALKPTPPEIKNRVEIFQPAPPPKPAPPKKTDTKEDFKPAPPQKKAQTNNTGTDFGTPNRPRRTAGRGKKTGGTSTRKIMDCNNLEELSPLSDPSESLSLCFQMISDEDWEKKTAGLKIVQALAQHHQEVVETNLCELCYAVTGEVPNLRSSVASVALETMVYLYVYMKTDMDVQVEMTGQALLLKIAQASVNAFLQQQTNIALEALVQNCSPGPVLAVLLNTGLSHLCPAVRASSAQQLHQLADRLGAERILTAGRTFTHRYVVAVNKMAVDSSAKVRPHGLAILQEFALQDGFMTLWGSIVEQKDRIYLEKSLKKMRRA